VHVTPRTLTLAASIAWRHLADDPVRAVLLAWRALPSRLRPLVRKAGPYGAAAALWGAGERAAALKSLDGRGQPRRLAAFALAVDQPAVAREALSRLAAEGGDDACLSAQLAWREGSLTDALRALEGRRTRKERRLRRTIEAQQAVLAGVSANGPKPAKPAKPRPRRHAVGTRVLHVVTDALPATSAGYTIRTHAIARAQRAAGLDAHVVTGPGFPVTKGILDGRRQLTLDGVPYHRLLPWSVTGDAPDQAVRHAARLAERLRPDILHPASNYRNAQVALALRERYQVPVVYEVRGFWEDTWLSRHPDDEEALRNSELYEKIRAAETACMKQADLVVTLGEAMHDEITSRGIPADKIQIVPNAVDETFLEPLMRQPHDEYLVGTVTTLTPHEGIGTLLQAVAILRDAGVPARALIVGDGPELAALRRQAEHGGIPATFTGRVPAAKVRDFHALLDVFVVPRTRDRVCQLVTPLKPVEAMASGLCVVTSEVSALAEIVKHEVTGALTMPQDPVSLADCLEWLYHSPDIRDKLGTAARDWVARDRTWSRNAERYRQAYRRLNLT
jgi:glycosyltransferase involved in cell wall biosynthesis